MRVALDRRTPWDEMWQAMEVLIAQGKVPYVTTQAAAERRGLFADIVVVSVPGPAIAAALSGVTGLAGKATIDTCDIYGSNQSIQLTCERQHVNGTERFRTAGGTATNP
jgi:hypothetical protein